MLQKILVGLALVFVAACTKTQICDNAKKITNQVNPILAAASECENPAELEIWMNQILVDVKLCEKVVASGPVGEFLCPIAYDAVHSALLKGYPEKAKCKKVLGEEQLKELFMTNCKKI